MLRYLRYGTRNYRERPDLVASRTSWEFFVVFEGEVRPTVKGDIEPGFFSNSLWLLRPGISYNWHPRPDAITRATFHFSSISDRLRMQMGSRPFIRRDLGEKDKALIENLAQTLMPYYLNPTELFNLYSDKALLELSLLFLEPATEQSPRPLRQRASERTRRAEEWYQRNIKSRPMLGLVAKEVGVSVTQLRRDFYTVYGQSPQKIFRRLRLNEGARLLANTDWTIEQVYPESGFASRVDFSRAFKEEYQVSPYQWRRNIALNWRDLAPGGAVNLRLETPLPRGRVG